MNSAVKTLFAAFVIAAFPLASVAADPAPEMYNARALAIGGAVTSVVGKTMSARANPAALVPEKGYFASATYLTRSENQLDAVAVTVVDNNTAPIAGAFNYLRVVTEGENEEAGLSLAAGSDGAYWGMTGRFAHTRSNRTADWESTFQGDVGLLLLSEEGFAFGLVGRDLLDSSYDALERRIACGVSTWFDFGLLVSADFVRYADRATRKGYTAHYGLEWKPGQTPWAIRGGYMNDAINREEFFSAGLGWTNQRIEFDYAYRRNFEVPGDALHTLTFVTPF